MKHMMVVRTEEPRVFIAGPSTQRVYELEARLLELQNIAECTSKMATKGLTVHYFEWVGE